MTSLHADHIGSLLRPPELLEARQAHDRGDLGGDALERAEDQAILEALEMQREVGLQIFSDGEYRRSWFAGGLPAVVDGLVANDEAVSLQWEGAGSSMATTVTTEVKLGTSHAARRLRTTGRIHEKEVAFLREHAPGPFKATTTGPLHFVRDWYRPGATDAYPDTGSMIDHVVEMLAGEVAQLTQEGVSYMQLDSLLYVIPAPAGMLSDEGLSREAILDAMVDADNAVLAPAREAGITTALHMCRGNNRSSWIPTGDSYESTAEQAFSRLQVDRLLLEYDTDRAGGFAALRFVPGGTTVVLGLISSKFGELESREELLRRIEQATEYVPIERLGISPQCGFASTAPGNLISWDDQRRKLELVVSVAEEVWGS
jgi:5-methyltetrahydropteroyltriglutamate--homocysteine methyltransferase